MTDETEENLEETEVKIPRLSADLIDFLDQTTQLPRFPTSVHEWKNLNEQTLNQLAFQSGYRACVNDLVAWLYDSYESEVDDVSDDNKSIFDKEFGRVLDNDGKECEEVAPVHMVGKSPSNVFRDYSKKE